MHRLAIFVEGYTEVLFVEGLISAMYASTDLMIDIQKIRGGNTKKRTLTSIKLAKQSTNQKYYILIIDCGGDKLVKTRILEEHNNLTKKGYSKIIGIRDVRPDHSLNDVPRLEQSLRKYIKTALAPVEFILCTMEIEAWFLAEINHFSKIEPSITCDRIQAKLGFHPETDDLSLRQNPTDDLNACYMIGGKSYTKAQANLTTAALDNTYIYCELSQKIPYLNRLIQEIENSLV